MAHARETLRKLLDLHEQLEDLGSASTLAGTLRTMTLGEAIDTVKRLLPAVRGGDPQKVRVSGGPALSTLSDRELEVVRLVADGLSNKEISGRLKVSEKTVKNHISRILAKMNFTARTQVAVYAIRAGLV